MSLSGVLDQSDVERRGFAALLQQKLGHLQMEDDMESEVTPLAPPPQASQLRQRAAVRPATVGPEGVRGWREEDTIDSDSLNIINESDLSPPSRSFRTAARAASCTPALDGRYCLDFSDFQL